MAPKHKVLGGRGKSGDARNIVIQMRERGRDPSDIRAALLGVVSNSRASQLLTEIPLHLFPDMEASDSDASDDTCSHSLCGDTSSDDDYVPSKHSNSTSDVDSDTDLDEALACEFVLGPIEDIDEDDDDPGMAEIIKAIYDGEAMGRREALCVNRAILLKRKHKEKLVAGDGNCFFRAVAIQTDHKEAWHKSLRAAVIKEVRQHRDFYKPFFTDCTTDDWLRKMAKNQQWCDNAAVAAAANVLWQTVGGVACCDGATPHVYYSARFR